MAASLIISFRECLEMLLVIVPLLIYLKKIDKTQLSKFVYLGSVSGFLTSLLIGFLIYLGVNSFTFAVQDIFVGSTQMFLAFLILYSMVIMRKQKKEPDSDEEPLKESNISNVNRTSLFILAFITLFRESLEITLFSLPYLTTSKVNLFTGTILGFLLALLFMYVFYRTSQKLKLSVIFNFITFILILMGSFMFGEALYTLLPSYGESLEKAGMLIYFAPTFIIYVKSLCKQYLQK